MAARRLPAVAACAVVVALVAVALPGQERPPALPPSPRLPPIPPEVLEPLAGPVRTVVRDVAFTTPLGARVTLPYVEIVGVLPRAGADGYAVELLRLSRPTLFSQSTGAAVAIDPFTEIPVPRLSVGRLLIEDGEAGALAPAGSSTRWLWRQHDIDIDARDIVIGGSGEERLRVVRADFSGQVSGRPLAVTRLTAAARRNADRLTADADVSFGQTRARLDGVARRDGSFVVGSVVDPLRFAEVRAFVDALPRTGAGLLDVRVAGTAERLDADVRRAEARVGVSEVVARGRLSTGQDGVVDDVVIDIRRLRSSDLEAAYGVGMPGAGEWRGRLTATGPLRRGVEVEGTLDQVADIAPTSIRLGGRVWAAPSLALDLRLDARPLRLADTAFAVAVHAEGPLDSLRLRGDAALLAGTSPGVATARPAEDGGPVFADARAEFDARLEREPGGRVLRGRADATALLRDRQQGLVPVRAEAEGSTTFAGDGRLDVVVRADSVPVHGLPLPAPLDSASGWLAATGRLGGTLEAPTIDGRVDGRGIVLLRTDSGTALADAAVRVGGRLEAPTASGRVDVAVETPDGVVPAGHAEGSAVLARAGPLDVDIVADSLPFRLLPVPDGVEDVRGAATGRIAVTGTLDDPAWDGLLRVSDGGLRVVRTGSTLSGLGGVVRVSDDAVSSDDLRGELGGGPIELRGRVTLSGKPSIDARARLERGTVVDTDSARVVASAELRATGPLDRASVEGSVVVHEGTMHEDVVQRREPLDVEDPPYAELVGRVPWLTRSRLRPEVAVTPAAPAGPFARAHLDVRIERGFSIIDEDSEMYGTGRVVVDVDSAGVTAEGVYRIEGGEYNNFGERFNVVGGAFSFDGTGTRPRITLRAEHDHGAPIGTSVGSGARAMDYFPPLEFFAIGTLPRVSEEVRRLSLLPESQTQLGAMLIYGEPVQAVRGLRMPMVWEADDGNDLVGERAESQSIPLLWAYTADEGYDYVALSRGYLRSGVYTVGSAWPARLVVGGVLRGGVRFAPFEGEVSYAIEGGAWPGVQLRWETGPARLSAFNEPRFRGAAATGEARPGYRHLRRTGVRLLWSWQW
jgi:hypothetical protein